MTGDPPEQQPDATPATHAAAPRAPEPDAYAVTSPDHPLARAEHERGLWALLACSAVGVWLIGSPASLGYAWTATGWSEWVSGALAGVLGVVAIHPRRWWASWALCALGVWLLFAPLAFGTVHAAAYLNSTLSGILLVGLSVIGTRRLWAQPVQPGIPPGWSFNPSSWVQRTPIVALAWLCFLISRYLTGYQLDYSGQAWDPLFGDGTQRVLDSEVAEAWPISDAGLGAMAYALEALVGCMGGASRWRTAPWVVALFGVLVVPAGVVSVVLIILQPVAVGAWCTLCLVTAVAMLIMACLTLPEVAAMMQHLARSRGPGRSRWQVFWQGGPAPDGQEEVEPVALTAPPSQVWRTMVEGVTVPWTLVASLVLGLWIMLSPPIFGMENPGANSHFLAGWLVITVTVLAMAEVARPARWVNVLLGGWVIATPWLLAGTADAAQWNAVISGVLLIVLSIPRGRIAQQYGTWGRWLV
ncbi:MAG: vitamin K epoxide reductase family protein [Phycisphaeraceae bacterium]